MTQLKPHNDIQIATGQLGEPVMGPQRQQLTVAVHSGLAPIRTLSSGFVRMPGGHHALAHIHAESEIQVYVVRGRIASLVGPDMTPTLHGPGSLVYIAPGVEHVGVNLDPHEPAELVEFRTDPAFNTDVVPITGLDALAETRVTQLRREYLLGRCDKQLAIPSVHAVTR
ncbi:Uncharacterized protein, RmlC-like cupin domain [Amycolatopsis tolypomycina]|uniref:Uncharacterized protein, RmlC-like cupin domain n=1 Tax=Amycolatopsis tolypomycina TaxID=208445 RepID=A0A1H4JIE4_9PSEU|nr:cupin domain-containing protein [Amycolatopsis tolypomycina]SEB46061.1 Uncharacterized protein, RmlC-like cupin domain [Amycolatopsis tolypomycina]